ncbi:hypothetical protein [Curtobacterium flaccumfaciens]|uniref:hypothetical protein n=1 Tax=Curtobacterium flaccumfaciens TaxID=2035 RepID=UPI00160107E4|nr:hypothetical protein [Curtobacterium flaccumfaciens]MBB1198624.1 hypothetical protein [Curtobacterium flaccumfaciens]
MGTEEIVEQLGARVLYVPWNAESVTTAAELALELRNETHARGVVVVDQMTVIPDELLAWPHHTLKTRTVIDAADVVAVIRPSYELLAQVRLPASGFAVVAEDPSDRLSGWAQFAGARNMVTGEVMTADLDKATQDAFDALIGSGYKGWTDDRSQRKARDAISTLRALGMSSTQILGYVLSGATSGRNRGQAPFAARQVLRLRRLLS